MGKRIAIIQGHPDISDHHLGHALARAYCEAAERAGHEVRQLNVAELDIPMLHSKAEWESGPVPDAVLAAQQVILWADHLLVVHPLWLGSMPATLKAFLEQVFRPGFAVDPAARGWKQCLGGRSARVIVTMGMPALVYRYYFLSHGLKSLVRNVLKFSGIGPVRTTLIGTVEGKHERIHAKWLPLMSRYGAQGR
ncbi:MAG: hypothetical protein JWQ90_3663 [Hydrocarboniphaga sp.]|uniref:NAD(P)H-dependent oxidoreductase n=1 Tax=Hydrocarboniphaga sp. TaxID=2033016 RepID=UPI00260A8661|nr:NAD(P)H-dependent oxidoreductase [Hydrocarboniphaga sp.]MDB5971213.1 hypothetical protein [Hydrocarboniphaga sp.]